MSLRSLLTSVVAIALALASATPVHAIVRGLPAPCADRRFDPIGLFINAGAWSCAGWISGSCILIEPDCVLVARHSLDIGASQPLPNPAVSVYRVRFRRDENGNAANTFYVGGNNCHGVYQELRVVRFVDAPQVGSDMVLAHLERPVVGIRPMGVELNATPAAGSRIVLAGWGYSGDCFQSGEFGTLRYAVGLLPYQISGTFFTYTPCSVSGSAPCLTCPPGGPWASANLHDSGGAVMIEVPGPAGTLPELRLLGSISTLGQARRATLWNQAGGQPQIRQAVPLTLRDVADFNRDHNVSVQDLMDYLEAYFGGVCTADTNASGLLSIEDMYTYLNVFFTAQ